MMGWDYRPNPTYHVYFHGAESRMTLDSYGQLALFGVSSSCIYDTNGALEIFE